MKLKAVVWTVASLVAVSCGTFAGILLADTRDGGTQNPPFSPVRQDAKAESQGVLIEVLEASFSGTETVLRLKPTVVDDRTIAALVGDEEVLLLSVARDGFDPAGWAGYTLEPLPGRAGEAVMRLPPIVPGENYDGEVVLHVNSLAVRTSREQVRLEGNWLLSLDGPEPSMVDAVLRGESLSEQTLTLAGHSVRISGARSSSETVITIALPPQLLLLGGPTLSNDGRAVSPYLVSGSNPVTYRFPPTPFGSAVDVALGAIGVETGDDESITIALAAAIERSGGADTFDILPEDVIDGPWQLLVSGAIGSYGSQDWVNVRVEGAYHPNESGNSPRFLGPTGEPIELAHVQTGYTKNVGGNVSSGVTDIAMFVPKGGVPETVTLLLGGEVSVLGGEHTAQLRP